MSAPTSSKTESQPKRSTHCPPTYCTVDVLTATSSRSFTPPAPHTGGQNGLTRVQSSPANMAQSPRNGEPPAKVARTGDRPAPQLTHKEPKVPPPLLGRDEVQYEKAVATIVENEKTAEEHAIPLPDTPDRAAYLSRLDSDALSAREERDFPEVAQGPQAGKELHLALRNRVLQLWLRKPREHLIVRTVLEALSESGFLLAYDQDQLIRIIRFLNRVCLINYGDFAIQRPVPPVRQQRHIVVLGAGIAGLAAARQLRHFGFQVTVLEAKNRAGGRIDTWVSSSTRSVLAERGAMLVTGVEGNPIYTILHDQLGMKLESLDIRCPIFENDGRPVAQERDDAIELMFESLVAASPAYFRNHEATRLIDGQPYGMGQCIDEVLKQNETEITIQSNRQMTQVCESIKKLQQLYVSRTDLYYRAKSCTAELNKAVNHAQMAVNNGLKDVPKRLKSQLTQLYTKMQDVECEIQTLEALPDARTTFESDVNCFITDADRRLLSWHMANYEFANAMPIERISVEHWDQDEELELKGGHYFVPGGLHQMTDRLATGLNIVFNHKVVRVAYDRSGVVINARGQYSNSAKEFVCDAVISTLPLGVMKHSLSDGSVLFHPPMPMDKVCAIRRLGFGVLNKVILTYTRKFWKAKRTWFGYANGNPERRGEFFMFWGLYDQPVLIALIAGKSAEVMEDWQDAVIVQACTQVLQKIFGRSAISMPKESVVTRWGSDEFSRGSYSSVPVGASGADFDTLAEPIEVDGVPRVCFAGEHTVRRYPGTMHGAMLSGFREATRIADSFNGTDNIY